MYLHLGDDCCVAVSSILAILDIKVCQDAFGDSLLKRESRSSVPMGKEPRSVVVTDEAFYFSVISVQSLRKRMESTAYGESLHDFAAES